jgi:LPXTG-motif cell wall-anchored protein
MKELIRKISLVLVAVLLLVGNVTQTVSALDGNEKATVTIESVEKGSTVKFYRVVEPKFESGNLTGYKLKSGLVDPEEEITVTAAPAAGNPTKLKATALDLNKDGFVDASPVTIDSVTYTFTEHQGDLIYNMEEPTQEQINKAVSKDLLGSEAYTATAGTYIDENGQSHEIGDRVQQLVTAGQYIAIIVPTDSDTTYNPVVVSAGYTGQQKYRLAKTTETPPEEGTYYKKLDGTFTDTERPTAETKYLYEADAWDDTAGEAKAPRWVKDDTTTIDTLIAKNLDADSNYKYIEGTTAIAKLQKPKVEKDVETDHPENAQVALAATDKSGDCKLDASGNLVYVKAPFTDDQHKNTRKGTTFYKLVDGVVSEWVDGTDDPALKLDLSAMETSYVDKATTMAATAYSGGQGEEVRYTVTPTIPQYPANAKNKTLSFTDKFQDGIDFVPGSIDIYTEGATPLTKQYNATAGTYEFFREKNANDPAALIKYINDNGTIRLVNPTAVPAEVATHVLVAKASEKPGSGNTFQINFDYDALPGTDGNKKLNKITYLGAINDSAVQGIPGNVNVVKMHYSNSTGTGSSWIIDKFNEPSGEGITERHDEGRVYTYEIRFVKTNDEDQYKKVEASEATHILIPDAEDALNAREKEEYALLVAAAVKGLEADGSEHMYVTVTDFNTIVTSAAPDVTDLNKGYYVENSDFEYLSGAVFGLYDANGNLVCEITTGSNGVGHTTNVGPGTYTLKEITPPVGYTKTTTPTTVTANWTSATTWSTHTADRYVYTVTISEAMDVDNNNSKPTAVAGKTNVSTALGNEFAEDQIGWLVGTAADAPFYENTIYDVTNNEKVTAYDEENHKMTLSSGIVIENIFRAYLKEKEVTSSETSNTVYNNNGGTVSVARINNTKTVGLPSTGGIGTYMFTIAGVAILATAAFMLIFKKQKVQ